MPAKPPTDDVLARAAELRAGGSSWDVVATKLLGPNAGVLSGCALLVDYVLTITTSIAAAGDALFSLLPSDPHLQQYKVPNKNNAHLWVKFPKKSQGRLVLKYLSRGVTIR